MPERKAIPQTPARARTKDALLLAARDLVAKKGYGGVSVSDIATDAGYTKGAFFSNFPTREAMLLELLALIHAEQRSAMESLEKESSEDLPHAIDHLVELVVRHALHPLTPLLVAEVQLQAKRDEGFSDAVSVGFEYQLTAFAGWIDRLKKRHRLTTPMTSIAIARTVMALAQGYALQPADNDQISVMAKQILVCLLR